MLFLFSFCPAFFILILYSNLFFVVVASNQTGEEGLASISNATKAVTAVDKVIAAMFKVVVTVLDHGFQVALGLQWLRLCWCRRL